MEMNDINDRIREAFNNLISEFGKYREPGKELVLLVAYGVAQSRVGGKYTLDNNLVLLSLKIACELAELRFVPEFLASAILYYPVITGNLPLARVQEEFGLAVKSTIDQLIIFETTYEENEMPWNQIGAGEKSTKRKQQRRNDVAIKDFWEERTRKKLPEAVLKSIPQEIIVAKLVERLYILKDPENLVQDRGLLSDLANETLHFHAEVAERLGIWSIKWRLDDYAFKIISPDIYEAIAHNLNDHRAEREETIERAIRVLQAALEIAGVKNAQIAGRPKHIYGLFQKMQVDWETNKDDDYLRQKIQDVNDALGIRVIVSSVGQCYRVLSILHQIWPPAKGVYGDKPYRDWISQPKPNGYKSIHATVVLQKENNRLLEVQIRTDKMHELAEFGIAAHWIYKNAPASEKSNEKMQKQVQDYKTLRQTFEKRQKKSSK